MKFMKFYVRSLVLNKSKFLPDKYLTIEFIQLAIKECMLKNDLEGIVELLEIFIEEKNFDEKNENIQKYADNNPSFNRDFIDSVADNFYEISSDNIFEDLDLENADKLKSKILMQMKNKIRHLKKKGILRRRGL